MWLQVMMKKILQSINSDVPDYTKSLVNDIKGLKIGLPKEYFIDGMDEDVKKSYEYSYRRLKKLGAEIVRYFFTTHRLCYFHILFNSSSRSFYKLISLWWCKLWFSCRWWRHCFHDDKYKELQKFGPEVKTSYYDW